MALEALIFDVDGTLANTERDGHLVAFNLAFEKSGLDWVWSNELYHKLLDVTGGRLRIAHYVNDYGADCQCDDLERFAAELHQLKTDIYVRLVNEGKIPLRPGVERLFHEARQAGLRLAIATTTTLANVEALIVNTLGEKALDWFEVIGAGSVVENLKPSGEIYHWVLDQMQLSADKAIAFEDSYNGIVAAREANLNTLITTNAYTQTHQFDGAMAVLSNLGEPDKPFSMIEGDQTSHNYVNLDYLQELYAKNC